jgi:hypothetical protein
LITPIAHLYGSLLDDFVDVTLRNHNDHSVRIVVTSEIIGFTPPPRSTRLPFPGQNPRLMPKAIDKLNAVKPADFHLRAVYLEGGQERELLNQTGGTKVYARRDFPWKIEGFTQAEVFELLATMVIPNDPAVEDLIRTAADYNPSGTMGSGYQGIENDAEGRVWDRLQIHL